MKTIRTIITLLALTITTRAAPVTIYEFLAQDPQQPTGTVTIIESIECCEDEGGIPWWPILFAGAIPLVLIGDDDEKRIEIQPPVINTPTPGIPPTEIPEPETLSLGLLAVVGIFVWRRRQA